MRADRFDIEYNKWLQRVEASDFESVWQNVEDELDYIETWDTISTRLDTALPQQGKMAIMKYVKVLAASCAAILLMALPIKDSGDRSVQKSIISEQQDETIEIKKSVSKEVLRVKTEKENAIISRVEEVDVPPADYSDNELPTNLPENYKHVTIIKSKEIKKDTENIVKNIVKSDTENIIESNIGIIIENNIENNVVRQRQSDFDKIKIPPFTANKFLINKISIVPVPVIQHHSIESQNNSSYEAGIASGPAFRIVEAGLVYGFKNTWLLNNETRNGLKPGKMGNTLPTFIQDLGVATTLEFNKKHLLGIEFLWKSRVGQNYQQYINANYIDRSIELNYLKLQAFYLVGRAGSSGQLLIGGYFAKLTLAEEKQEKTIFSITGNYSDLDYGMLAGGQYNFTVSNRITIKPGLRISYNLVNIFKGDELIPSHLKKTKNLAASVNIAISYRFSN